MQDWQGQQADRESALDLRHQLKHQLMSSQRMCPSRHSLNTRGAAGGRAMATDSSGT